ncbi:MAG: glycosyltransferase family 4 protein [Patescibacteria group bacterium]|nr:glycosyltransferase family 4 protein [Patescibacteria group bacterium]
MRIGIDARICGINHGGIGRYVFELCKNVPKLDPQNQYLIFYRADDPSGSQTLLESLPVNAKPIPVSIRHYSIKEQLRFYKILDRLNLDLVHFPNFNVPLLYRRPFVVTIHDLAHHKISGHKKSHLLHFWAYKKIIQNAADRAKSIITVSQASKSDVVKYLRQPAEKITVIYEGASLPTQVEDARLAEIKKNYRLSRPYFLFVGVLERKKNLISLTRGFDEFIQKNRLDFDLVVVGKSDKHYPGIRHSALDIRARDRLVFCGAVEDTELAALYKGAYAFVSASVHEGFGLPGVEAMRFGLPLIVSNTEVFNEIYDNAAVYFNPLDPGDIAEKMRLLAEDRDFYKQVAAHSASRAALFSWEKMARETLSVYQAPL